MNFLSSAVKTEALFRFFGVLIFFLHCTQTLRPSKISAQVLAALPVRDFRTVSGMVIHAPNEQLSELVSLQRGVDEAPSSSAAIKS